MFGVILFSSLIFSNLSVLATDSTKIDWWIVRDKDHSTPRSNEQLAFNIQDYDAYYTGDVTQKTLYLTFDEGYENGQTSQILDALKRNNVPAIFFVTSPYIKSNPDLILRMLNEGHMVANHSKNHPSMPKYTDNPEVFKSELLDVEEQYKKITGKNIAKLFRPPMGHYSEDSLALTQSMGYQTLFWSFAYADFDIKNQPDHSKAQQLISDNLHNGAILLLHAVSQTNADILDSVIKNAQSQGYTFALWPINNSTEQSVDINNSFSSLIDVPFLTITPAH